MIDEQFMYQMQRLESTFGEKFFDFERLDLIKQHVMWMELGDFAKIVSHMIETFRQAPLPKDFKEAVIAHKNARGQNQKESIRIFDDGFTNDGLRRCLEEKYPGAISLREAVKIERLKIQLKKAME